MTAEQNKMLVRRLVEEAVNPRNPDVLDEIAQGEFAVAAIPLGPALPRLLPRLHDADRRPGRRQRQSGCAFPLLRDPPGDGWGTRRPAGASTMSMRSTSSAYAAASWRPCSG